jgi:hypothetical protein
MSAPPGLPDRLKGFPTLFGEPLESLSMNKDGVPSFLPVVCDHIKQNPRTVGLFRLCGDHLLVQEFGVLLNFPRVSIPPAGGINDIASFLKLWVRSLPVPLLTPSVVNHHFVPGNPDSVLDVLRHLAPVNRKCLALIFSMIRVVLDNAAVNQMSPANMTICFTMSLLQNNKDLLTSFKFSELLAKSFEVLNAAGDDFVV